MSLFDALGSLGGSLIGAGAGIYGAEQAANAAKKAGQAEMQMYWQNRKDYAPWRSAGTESINALRDAIFGNAEAYKQSPGYDFRLREGENSINRGASARGSLDSGATRKALMQYGQDFATDDYNNYLNRLATLAGFGSQAMGQTSALGANAARGYGQSIADAGAIRGTSYANAANTLLGGAGNAIRGYYY